MGVNNEIGVMQPLKEIGEVNIIGCIYIYLIFTFYIFIQIH